MLSKNILLHGRDTPPATKVLLRAGPLSMIFEPQTAFLRYICFEGREVLRGIYVAVRDEFWNTVTPRVTNLKLDQTDDSFRLTFQVECIEAPIDFVWQGEVTGNAGAITYDMKGVARSMFRRNRIGFCVLHPASTAGRPCIVRKTDGSAERGHFPDAVSPHQPFFDIRSISHEFFDGRWAEVHFEGDVFEMEDQRNWTDASFKTYCTPLSRPRPVEVAAGTTLGQQIAMRLKRKIRPPAVSSTQNISIVHAETTAIRLPRIGLGIASHGRPLSEREAELLQALRLDHVRVDLNLSDAGSATLLARAAAEARLLNTSLEVGLLFGDAPEADLEQLCDCLRTIGPPVVRWILFHCNHSAVSDRVLELARRRLTPVAPGALFGTGTDIYFTELNRERPPASGADFVCFSINPQVHAFDDDSLMETLDGQTAAAGSARRLYPNHSLVISPITLRPRFNPNGTKETAPGRLPPQVDPRQMSLFAAAWTLGSIGRLAAAGAESLTYHETTGWRGVIQTDDGNPSHAEFPSVPGAVFPVYQLLADLAELRGRDATVRGRTEPLPVEEVTFTDDGRNVTLLANLTAEPQHVSLRSEGDASRHRVRILDATTAMAAMKHPAAFRSSPGELLAAADLQLSPYALARVERLVE